jgi:hypothetical protein
MAPRTPLLRPDRYFSTRTVSGVQAIVIVALLALAGVATVAGVGWILTERIDGTVTVDNPAHPPEWVCEDDTFDRTGCDEPERIDRDVDVILQEAIDQTLGIALVALPLGWVLIGLCLHIGSWLADGDYGAVRSFAVAAWGLVPSLIGFAVGLVALWFAIDPVTVTGADDPSVLTDLQSEVGAVTPVTTVVSLATTAWGAIIWRYGLEHQRGLTPAAAWTVAAIVGGLAALGVLV